VLLSLKEETQEVVEKQQIQEQRVKTSTQVGPSIEGIKRTREVYRLV